MAINLTTGLSVDEFLDHSLDRCELLGGETRPKPLGTGKHSKMQRRLLRLLEAVFGEGRVEFELSMRIGDEVPVPDLVVLHSGGPRMYRDVLDEPPLLQAASTIMLAIARASPVTFLLRNFVGPPSLRHSRL